MRIYKKIDIVFICFSKKTLVLGIVRPPAVLFQEKKASEKTIMRICVKTYTFMCFSKKTHVLGCVRPPAVFFQEQKGV